MSKDLVVGPNKGVQWALVSLVGDKAGNPSKEAVLDQKGCEFMPRMVVTPKGKKLTILNSDGILHNVHTYSKKNPPLNKAQPGFKKKMKVKFDQAEIIKVTCDAHPWMMGWIIVADSPTVVTDEKGSFTLANVPAGTYKVKVWHEVLGEKNQEVTVKAGENSRLSFQLSVK